jgi:hypothetical protein
MRASQCADEPAHKCGWRQSSGHRFSNNPPCTFNLGTNTPEAAGPGWLSCAIVAPLPQQEERGGIRPGHGKSSLQRGDAFRVDAREKHGAYSIQKRKIASRTPDRNFGGTIFTPCGRRIGDRCYCFLLPRDCARPGTSVVRVAGKLSLLLLQNSGAMSVDGLWHRRLRAESAFTFPEQAARFPPETYKPVENLLSRMK